LVAGGTLEGTNEGTSELASKITAAERVEEIQECPYLVEQGD
jgi:hypothetical protein